MTTVHLLRPLMGAFPTACAAIFLTACAALGAAPASAAPTVTLSASPASVPYGGTTTLTWASTQASNCSIPWGSQATSGSYTTAGLFNTATFTITCYGPGGSQSGSVTVAVAGPPPAPTVSLVASPATVPVNSSSTLAWASTNATSCNTPWGATATSGSYTTPPITYDQAFTVTCSGYGGSNAATAFVRLGAAGAPAPVPGVALSANPSAVAYGGNTTLNWASSNASSCNTPWGSNAITGSFASAGLTASTTYTVSCSGAGGTGSASATVTVAAAPAPTSEPVPTAPTVQLSANPASIAYGASTTLTWSSTNATTCTTPWGSTATSGSTATPALTASTSYTISCNGPGGSQTASAGVTVAAQQTPPGGIVVSLTATPAAVAYGGSATLNWSATGANSCSLPWGGSATSGSYATPGLFSAATYTITCYGGGRAEARSASVTVAVGATPPAPAVTLTAEPATVALNGTSLLTWTSTNATSCNTPWGATATSGLYTTPAITYDRTFTVTCSGYGGSGTASVTVRIGAAAPPPPPPVPPTPTPTPTPAPTVTLTASPAALAYNQSTTLTWSASDAAACTTPWGATAVSGNHTTPLLTANTAYSITCTGAGGTGSASVNVTVAPQVAETNPPIIFNASTSAKAGDVVSLQGHNFGDTPFVALTSAPAVALEIVNRVGTTWLAVQIPASAQGALTVRVRNSTGTSAPVKLNGAIAHHLDAIQLVPGGAFRVFGRNLLVPGGTPIVRVAGLVAGVNLLQSNEHMLVATAPAALAPTAAAAITVDNGNGSGPAPLDRSIEVVPGSGDPFGLGVGWAAGFTDIATRTIDAATDARLSPKVLCNGSSNDSPAIQQAIQLAGSLGGAVVRLPAGRCRVAGGMNLQSRVVVQGAGKAQTELVYESNYPVFGVGLDLVGIRNLTLTNAGASREGPLLKQSTRVFVQNVRVAIGTSSQMYLDANRNVVITGSDFVQTGSVSHQGPYILNDSAGLVFQNNTTQWVEGAPAFGRIHDSYVQGNRFTRDARAQNLPGTVHSFTIDFAHRIAVIGNTFDVAYGPITNKTRNDGETILTEAGGASRTENLGNVASATAMTLSDPGNTLNVDPFGNGYAPENYGIAIVAGKGAGQTRRVVSYAAPVLTVERAWDVVPDSTSRYATFVWGLEKALIKDNTLSQNPRGIWLYQAAIRDVDIVGNTISEGGGIYLRSYQKLDAKRFIPIWNVLIARNSVSNTTGNWMSYINAMFVNTDARAFGIANLGIEMRQNQVTANRPNVGSQLEEYANLEGYLNMMRVENYNGYETSSVPRLLGSILFNNTCTNCDVAVRTGTGAGGTTILGTQLINSPVLWADWATTSTPEKSTGTVVR